MSVERIIPPHLLEKINALATTAYNIKEQAELLREQVREVERIGKAEGFSNSEIRSMILQGLKNRGLSDRSALRYLPQDVKSQRHVAAANAGVEQRKKEAPVQADTPDEIPDRDYAETIERKPERVEEEQPRERRTIADIVTPKGTEGEFPYYEGKIQALKQKIAELEANQPKRSGTIVVRVLPKIYAKLYHNLRTNVKYVDLIADAATGEVIEVEAVKH